jgi:hypothetical protein
MATAIEIEHTNTVYRAENCYDLPATQLGELVFTHWQFTPEERERIAKGELLRICIAGPIYPIRVDLANDPL